MFALQDGAMLRNRSAAPAEFDLIDRGLTLGFAITQWINDPPAATKRLQKSQEQFQAQAICANLLHGALSSLVSAVRLALYGTHVDSLALIRAAFEATYFADYFKRHEADATFWGKASEIKDFAKRRQYLLDFDRKKRVRQTLEEHYGESSMSDLFHHLSAFGPHATTDTVAMRMSSSSRNVANVGFASSGKAGATAICAKYILHITGYILSEFFEYLVEYIDDNLEIIETYSRFCRDRERLPACPPDSLSMHG